MALPRPQALPVRVEMIPAKLKRLRRWVVWRYVWDEKRGAWTKVPFVARLTQNRKASVSDPSTWDTFGAAMSCYENGNFDGIGFVLVVGDGLMGVDLDDCIDAETGEVHPWAEQFIKIMPGYWEVSPSGTGFRHIRRDTLPPGKRRTTLDNGITVEMYDRGRYLTITGHSMEGWINGAR
jgi:primase-polymerase (primpol)-like protein